MSYTWPFIGVKWPFSKGRGTTLCFRKLKNLKMVSLTLAFGYYYHDTQLSILQAKIKISMRQVACSCDLANGHAQNVSDQKSNTISEDQLFMTRNFAVEPEKILSV